MTSNPKIANWKYTILRVIFFCICCALILILFSPFTKSILKPWSEIILGILAAIAVFILTLVFAQWEKLKLTDIGVIPTKQTFPRFIYGFGIGLFLAIIQGLLVVAFSSSKLVYAPQTSYLSILLTLFLYLILAVREELAFRGYALRSLTYAIGSWKAQLIIAAIFSLEHWVGGYTFKQAFLGAGIGAVLFGIAAIKSKGIALPIGIHAAWNFGQWSIGFKNEPGIWQAIVEKGHELEFENVNFAFYLLVMILAIASFYFYKRKTSTAHNSSL
jgi:membrane protease YdiL (CAAX protease family)